MFGCSCICPVVDRLRQHSPVGAATTLCLLRRVAEQVVLGMPPSHERLPALSTAVCAAGGAQG